MISGTDAPATGIHESIDRLRAMEEGEQVETPEEVAGASESGPSWSSGKSDDKRLDDVRDHLELGLDRSVVPQPPPAPDEDYPGSRRLRDSFYFFRGTGAQPNTSSGLHISIASMWDSVRRANSGSTAAQEPGSLEGGPQQECSSAYDGVANGLSSSSDIATREVAVTQAARREETAAEKDRPLESREIRRSEDAEIGERPPQQCRSQIFSSSSESDEESRGANAEGRHPELTSALMAALDARRNDPESRSTHGMRVAGFGTGTTTANRKASKGRDRSTSATDSRKREPARLSGIGEERLRYGQPLSTQHSAHGMYVSAAGHSGGAARGRDRLSKGGQGESGRAGGGLDGTDRIDTALLASRGKSRHDHDQGVNCCTII